MRRFLVIALVILLCSAPLLGQEAIRPEYRIRNLLCTLEAGQITVRFDVVNLGIAAQDTAVAATGLASLSESLAT